MVLKLALVLALVPSCVHGPRVTRLPRATNVAVAYVVDRDDRRDVGDVPEEVAGEIARALRPRNLRPKRAQFASYSRSFESGRTTQHRLSQLASLALDTRLLLLVETKVAFYSQLNGRYRWNVYAKVTMASREALGEAVSVQVDAATFLLFAHEREPRALAAAATEIAERVGRLADDFLGGLEAPRADGARAEVDPYDAIYFVLVDRFANGDQTNDGVVDRADPIAFHGGDLQGVIDHLDDLQDLGVRTVWLSPVFATRSEPFMGHGAFHGYWVTDLDRLDPRFGSVELLGRLSDELHRRGMRLLLDVVLNHVAFDAPLVTEHPEWFHHEGPITDFDDRSQLVTREVHGLPDLAQERPEVAEYLLARSLAWIERVRPDGFRLDAVKHVPLSFWRSYNLALRSRAGGFVLLGEELDGQPQLLARTMREGAFSALFDFPLHFAMVDVFCRDQHPGRLAAMLSADRAYEPGVQLVTLLDNHDLPRIATACGGDLERVRQALTFLLTARGTPSITYGTEAGLEGRTEPDNRGDMRFTPDHPLRAHIHDLLALRSAHPALRGRATRMLDVEGDAFAYLRAGGGEVALVAVNRGDDSVAVILPAEVRGDVADAFDGSSLPRAVPVGPRSTRVAFIAGATLAPPSDEPIEVEFRVRGAPLGSGDALYIVGTGAELGDWSPERGIGPLELRGEELVASQPMPAGIVLEYKLVVRADSGTATWEAGTNRYTLLGSTPQRVDCTWRS